MKPHRTVYRAAIARRFDGGHGAAAIALNADELIVKGWIAVPQPVDEAA